MRLQRLLAWLLPINLGVAALEGVAAPIWPSAALQAALAATLGYSWCLLLACVQIRRGRVKASVTTLCAGFMTLALLCVIAWPGLQPALAFLPLVTVVLALSAIDRRRLRALIVGCWLVTAAIALLGEYIAPGSATPAWLTSALRIGAFVAASGMILLLMGRFGRRLTRMILQMQSDNVGLQITRTQLKMQNERLAVTLQSIGDGVITTDAEGRIALINHIGERITGWTQAEVAGRPFDEVFQLINEQTRDPIPNPVRSVLHDGAMALSSEHTALRRRDGVELSIADSVAPIRERAGQIIGAVFVFRDITERKRAEDERRTLERKLLEMQKLESLGVLAGGIAHDFNNLLAAILGNAELALCDLPPASPARESLEQIASASRRAANLTQQMLAYAGKALFLMQRLDLSALIDDFRGLLDAALPRSVAIDYQLAPDLPLIDGDPALLRQAVMNLVINAAEALGERDGRIRVTSGVRYADARYLAGTHLGPNLRTGHYACLEISDSGGGMDQETQAKIFDPFFTTKFTGRGLGLASVLGIVRSHQGAVKVESAPGSGTTITLLFPCEAAPAAATPDPRPEAIGWRGGTVLVIDDEELVRKLLSQLLERQGFSVLSADDGRAGVEVFRAHADAITCILLDMTMPHLNGEQTFHAIRRIRSDARVVLMSGYDENELSSRFAGQGLAGILHKPFSPSDLSSKVQQALVH